MFRGRGIEVPQNNGVGINLPNNVPIDANPISVSHDNGDNRQVAIGNIADNEPALDVDPISVVYPDDHTRGRGRGRPRGSGRPRSSGRGRGRGPRGGRGRGGQGTSLMIGSTSAEIAHAPISSEQHVENPPMQDQPPSRNNMDNGGGDDDDVVEVKNLESATKIDDTVATKPEEDDIFGGLSDLKINPDGKSTSSIFDYDMNMVHGN
ncbi:unnamed protein product [Cochlearia groenlandica]